MSPKYPDIHVELGGHKDGEYGPLAQCLGAIIRAGVSGLERERFTREATAGDYNVLRRVSAEWLAVAD